MSATNDFLSVEDGNIPTKYSNLEALLQRYFGYTTFRKGQREVIEAAVSGTDSLVLMPTGGGKSICYQLAALMLPGITVVISPLIALMKDQTDALRLNGIKADFLNSTLSTGAQQQVLDRVANGELKMLYLAPERLLSGDEVLEASLKKCGVSLLAVDEAHCISQWGHDFRPEYRQIAGWRDNWEDLPVMALTATADILTRDDIEDKLHLQRPFKYVGSFNRPNITYRVQPKRNSFLQLLQFLDKHKGDAGIVYTLSRKSAENLAERLREEGFNALPYHAGLTREERENNQDLFLRDEVDIITATIAFGMGIDKSNVRFVVHMDLPKNVEGYYQETGRAGRDGMPSEALLLFGRGDIAKLKYFAEIEGDEEQTAIQMRKLDEMARYGSLHTCRRRYLLQYFDEDAPETCGNCDNCLSEQKTTDGTREAMMALSAVARLKEQFGTNYVIDFLRGSKSEKIHEWHREIKTYGVGAELSRKRWLQIFDELLGQNILEKAHGKYPLLKLNDTSWRVLRGEIQVKFTEQEPEPEKRKGKVSEETLEYPKALFEEMRGLRKHLADLQHVPAFVILSDASLAALAHYRPQTIDDLYYISGFGEMKVRQFGEHFLRLIKDYCERNQLEENMRNLRATKGSSKSRKKKKPREKRSDTRLETLRLFRKGMSIEDIATHRDLRSTTIANHLATLVSTGDVELTELVPQEKATEINKVFDELHTEMLTPVKNLLGDQFAFFELKAVLGWREWKRESN